MKLVMKRVGGALLVADDVGNIVWRVTPDRDPYHLLPMAPRRQKKVFQKLMECFQEETCDIKFSPPITMALSHTMG